MRIRVLGRVAAFDEQGSELPVGGPKQKAVLAMLTLSPGSVVGRDQVIEAVWGDDVPDRANRSVSTYVSNLRGLLGDIVESRTGGYALAVDGSLLDAKAFEIAIGEGRYGDALDLWKGDPYADVDGHGAFRGEIQRLHELRLTAARSLIRELVDDGHEEEALQRLSPLLERYPLDEELISLHMETLYRAGRQADALAAFGSYRARLADELGLDPSPDLSQLELKILQHDDSLTPAEHMPDRPNTTPVGLPLRYSSFVGRDRDVAELTATISEHRLVTVVGPGGIGKSSVAVEAVRNVITPAFPVAYLKLEPVRPALVTTALAEAVGLKPIGGADPLAVLERYLASYPHLLVLDGCEAHTRKVAEIVEQVLSASECVVVATSRRRIGLPGEHVIRLAQLPDDAAVRLFFDRAPGVPETDDATSTVARICDAVDGMPLAVELAAARASSLTLDRIESRLGDQIRLLARRSSTAERHGSLASTVAWSYELLDEGDRDALLACAMFSHPFTLDDAAALTGNDLVDDSVSELVTSSLLEPPDEAGRYRILEPIRQYARGRLEDEGRIDDHRLRYAAWLADESERRYRTYRIERDDSSYLAWLGTMAGDIATATAWAVGHGHDEIALHLVAGNGRRWMSILDAALLAPAALEAVDSEAVARDTLYRRALAQTGWLWRILDSEVAAALLERIESEIAATDDLVALQALLDADGAIRHQLNSDALTPDTAERLVADYRRLLDVTRQLGEPTDRDVYNLAMVEMHAGHIDVALDLIDQALDHPDSTRPTIAMMKYLKSEFLRGEGLVADAVELAIDASQSANDADLTFEQTMCDRGAVRLFLDLDSPDEAAAQLERLERAHQIIGLPPVAEFNPFLIARFRTAQGDWDGFAELILRALDEAPPAEKSEARQAWLEGSHADPSGIPELLHPVAAWLATHERDEEARRLLAAAPMAFAQTRNNQWHGVGEVARVDALRGELGDGPTGDVPATLSELYDVIAAAASKELG